MKQHETTQFSILSRIELKKISILVVGAHTSEEYRVAKTHRMPYLDIISHKRILQLVALF